MGYSVRTETHRYTEWRENDTGKIINSDLYNYLKDPLEMRNTASSKESQSKIAELSKLLRSGWPKLKTKK